MHILPEVYAREHHHPHEEHDSHEHAINQDDDEKNHGHPTEKGHSDKFSRGVQLVTLIAGMFTAELLAMAPDPH